MNVIDQMISRVLVFLLKWTFILFFTFWIGTGALAILFGDPGNPPCPNNDRTQMGCR